MPGAGNIGQDMGTYIEGDIVREGTPGVSSQPDYSAGRGGAGTGLSPTFSHPISCIPNPHPGNIVHPLGPPKASEEVVPESATRVAGAEHDSFHTGRGGQGNVHKDKNDGHSKEHDLKQGGLLNKIKHVIGLDKKEKMPEPVTK